MTLGKTIEHETSPGNYGVLANHTGGIGDLPFPADCRGAANFSQPDLESSGGPLSRERAPGVSLWQAITASGPFNTAAAVDFAPSAYLPCEV